MYDAERYCPSCAAVVTFEQPPCPDDHDECPELACTLCGAAVFAAVAGDLDPTPVEEHHAA